jgi:DsbC/DsbD-like thiol-disulfide interchange protein
MGCVLHSSLTGGRPASLLPLFLFTFLFTSHLSAEPAAGVPAAADDHGSVQLIAEDESIRPGRDSWVGLYFRLEPQWHIYWINPGDSGEPPRVEWDLSAGFRAGPLQWPHPERLNHPPLTDFGYEGEVLLIAPIHAPAGLDAREITLAADVKWLVCRDICIPAQQRVALSLPVRAEAPQPDPRWHTLFAEMRARCPKRAPAAWKVTAQSSGGQFVLSIETGTAEAGATFFPLEPLQIEDTASQEVSSFRTGVRLTLQKSEQLLKPIPALKGVVVLSSGRAFLIDAPVVYDSRADQARRRAG